MPDESPRTRFERLQKQLQDSILRNFPNPERLGCPGRSSLQELARRPMDEDIEGDANWQHVTHCSECYREFLDIRAGMKRKRRTKRAAVGLGLVLLMVAGGLVFLLNRHTDVSRPKRPQIAEQIYHPRIVDLEGRSVRLAEKGNVAQPILLRREPEELTIRLPFGSKPGTYEIQLLKTADHPLLSATGEAKVENGVTSLTTRVDLSNYEPGKYLIGVRQIPFDWTYYPVTIE
jgi:hypothetical protein